MPKLKKLHKILFLNYRLSFGLKIEYREAINASIVTSNELASITGQALMVQSKYIS